MSSNKEVNTDVNERNMLAMMFPLMAVAIIVVFSGGLGVIFMMLFAVEAFDKWGVIVLGSALVVGVPSVAFMLQRKFESEQ